MNLDYTPEEQVFRATVRSFIDEHLPSETAARVLRRRSLEKEDFVRWQKILHRAGWGAPAWPREFGGAGWTGLQQYIFEEECADAGAPMQLPFGPKMVAPILMEFGSEAQQKRFLPRILSGDDWWCQGFSEPGAGSDLASLKTRADLVSDVDGEHYIVNGQKTWTTYAHHADWIFCLVRTRHDCAPQQGISFLLIDMASRGVHVRPIVLLDGEHEVNEVWFEDVRVPVANRVGEENKGWTYAKSLLANERTDIARVGRSKAALKYLKVLARREQDDERALIENARFRDRIAQLGLELMALELTNLRAICSPGRQPAAHATPSMLKLRGSEIEQTLNELMMLALGHRSLLRPEVSDDALGPGRDMVDSAMPHTGNYFNCRKTSIYGGSNEIQKNLISRIIGL